MINVQYMNLKHKMLIKRNEKIPSIPSHKENGSNCAKFFIPLSMPEYFQ